MDILGDAGAERYAKAVEIAAKDPNSDGMLVILTPQAMTDPVATAEALEALRQDPRQAAARLLDGRPGSRTRRGHPQRRRHSDLQVSRTPPRARSITCGATAYNLRALYETPAAAGRIPGRAAPAAPKPRRSSPTVRKSGRTILTEFESKQLLSAYGIPTVDTRIATTEDEAVKLAGEIGYPVVLKLYSETITHKTDVGGVQLNLRNAAAVRSAWRAIEAGVTKTAGKQHFLGVTVQPMINLDGYEIIIGSSLDPQFGPVLLFGSGGQLVEVYKDRALALPPLNATLARRMMEQTKIYTALKGVRGRAAGEPGRARGIAGALQPPGGRAALDLGNRHQPAAGLPGTPASRWTPAWCCTTKDVTEDKLPKLGHPALPDAIRLAVETEERHPGHHPPDPAGRRAAAW